jgi:hypothetical protein
MVSSALALKLRPLGSMVICKAAEAVSGRLMVFGILGGCTFWESP